MTADSAALDALLGRAGLKDGPVAWQEIHGGVSHRRYFRAARGAKRPIVAMVVPESSPEMQRARSTGRRWPFLEVRELLDSRHVRVPELYVDASAEGVILLEDLGATLADHLREHPSDREILYHQAVGDLAAAQAALATLPEGSCVLERCFDVPLLSWEVEHFREWGVLARGFTLTAEEAEGFESARRFLVETIAGWPRRFVHRDYQSRNLMVLGNADGSHTLGWIDFQDAMLGPRAYDLVALLCDSYQDLNPSFIQECLGIFAAAQGLTSHDTSALRREFDFITVQRKLKDAGRFVFVERTKGDPSYLPFVGPTLERVRHALERLADVEALRPLQRVLDRVAPR